MKRSAVLFVEKATPATITEFHDVLSNDLESVKEKWSFEFKTFRSSVKNLPVGEPKLLHAVTFSHRDNQSVVIRSKSAIVTTAQGSTIPDDLVLNSCSAGACEPFDSVLMSKLSNLWTLRQSIKGDFGSTYKTTELTIRAANIFSYGSFKGLVIELECEDDVAAEEFQQRVDKICNYLKDISVGDFRTCSDHIDPSKPHFLCDVAYQYIRVLEL
ncbi:LAMI_0D03950g1_1 [Lachancea mirantina]|uniref:Mediator of RNA polymerase II transcription subunit 20 n=1 Tax=Lachancea mirantina TaxID=1230905 RepID=A0A1G4JA33_9SACH|nr:LAMI_0D03950g1_1 [Lachancea mirantina]